MLVPQKLIKFLDSAKIKYETIKHRTVYTAFDKAATLRIKPNIIGKTLIVKTDNNLVVVLIPGNKNLDKNKFKKIARAKKTDFASEKLIKNKLKGAKAGAVPPFGNLWKLPTFADKGLFRNQKIIINGGEYTFSIKIKAGDMKKLIPDLVMGNFSKSRRQRG